MSELPDIQAVPRKKRAPKRVADAKKVEALPDITVSSDERQPIPPAVAMEEQPEPAKKQRKVAPKNAENSKKDPPENVDIRGVFQKFEESMRDTFSEKIASSKQAMDETSRKHMEKFDFLQQHNKNLSDQVASLKEEISGGHKKLLDYFEAKRENKEKRLKEEKEKEMYERLRSGFPHGDRGDRGFAWPSGGRSYY